MIKILYLFFIINLSMIVAAQNRTSRTDPSEVSALNSIFRKWRIPAQSNWNISGEPCSGAAIDVTVELDNLDPGIKCSCTDDNGTLCHIIALKVYAMDVRGVIPDELWNLTFLSVLDLRQNYLTGPLSPLIGNLILMQYLSVSINLLSGELPRELGRLTKLKLLSFSGNNFSGPLPSEVGELTDLEQIYIDSSGLSGEIPPSFANLRSMSQVWASDNRFTGRIPDFIGNWSSLTVLRLQGTGLRGPIPSSFSNLTSLTDLRISDLSDGSSSLDFIANLTSLSILILRNNNISGPIPANISKYRSLFQLDLSFNNLAGEIPDSLFSSSLNFLFLGNNRLTGTLPEVKNPSLNNIDLSYNELSGPFPSWINERKLQINLVANNFSLESGSNSSNLPSGLNCLQRNFPCHRDPPIYHNFSIKCGGGPEITSADQVVYESDNAPLGPATYNVSSTNRWAVSNVGLFESNSNRSYTASSSSQFTNTLDSELFHRSRISAGSLRYYGLGLENGNYTLTLQFAEIQIANPPKWQSHGRRVFDIYIQGILVEKDYDIKREAGGVSFRAVRRNINNVKVTENYVDIHLFWAGKGTCCIPVQGTYGPSISAISATPEFEPTVANNPPTTKREKSRAGLIGGIVVPVAVVTFLSLFVLYCFVQRRKKQQTHEDDDEFLGMETRPCTFTYAALRDATDDFNPSNKLGEGGFGPVYKGTLEDGRAIAVKQLSVASHQGKSQFVAEIATISAVQHRNLVKLYGCCIEADKKLLVYEYLENKSLDQAIFAGIGKCSLHLSWSTRFDICLGVARGLTYLHEESRLRIVHRDVKASNILLDSDMLPKISDFGLAKLYDDKETHIITRVAGTIGYLAPEYAMRGHLTEKADVFGFGVVALEIVSGRKNSDSNLEEDKIYLLEWAWNLHETNRELELVDSNLLDFDEEEVKRMIGVALLCTQTSPNLRPPMSRVVAMLSGDTEMSSITTRPGYLTDWNFNNTTSFMCHDDTLTTKTEKSHYGSSSSTTIVTDADCSPVNASQPTVGEIVGEGR